ncbi:hypothetical protein NWF24_14735 [Variovorax paradoxus]|uniref:hypothetical protein n=1 Tax=Variovorax paradoxus TaxID=34073 RepID=UPI0021ACEDAF|nr:hypothetical protein [Variovorax paradoxus]UVH60617.1 hypothetical protein NWF24_14735 [Variovorax paradoxus]
MRSSGASARCIGEFKPATMGMRFYIGSYFSTLASGTAAQREFKATKIAELGFAFHAGQRHHDIGKPDMEKPDADFDRS